MTEAMIREAIASCAKGANVKLVMERPAKLRAKYKGLPMFKRSTMTIRVGVENDNRKDVIEARANGDRPAENQGLKGFEWVEAPTLLRAIKTGKLYLRVEPSINAKERPKSEYLIRTGDIETIIDKEANRHQMLASEFTVAPRDACFNIGIDNVLSLNGIGIEVEAEVEAAN